MPQPPKTETLRQEGTLHPHPESVADSLFQEPGFFDPEDLVQVKYEMLRRVRVEGHTVQSAATDFGVSRPTWYEAQAAFEQGGGAALVPKKRGPRGPHKLTGEALEFVREQVAPGDVIHAAVLSREIERRFDLTVHPRTIERAVGRSKKKHS